MNPRTTQAPPTTRAAQGERGRHIRTRDVMHGPAVCVDAADTLWNAMDAMLGRGLRHLVVVREGRAIGMLSDRDLAALWAFDPLGLKNRTAEDALPRTRPLVQPETDVVGAARQMLATGADAVVVVDAADAPLGVLTDHDLLHVLVSWTTDSHNGE